MLRYNLRTKWSEGAVTPPDLTSNLNGPGGRRE